jgi:hypothetical protein
MTFMKITLNKRSLLRKILVMLVCAVVVAIAYFELGHRYNFGHFVAYGLHVDVLSEDVSIGIPGQKKMYKAELSNFSFWPVRLEACDYLTDAFGRGTEYPYAVQRWDSASSSWQTIVAPNGDDFCHPVPLSTIETHRTSRRLWPGMQVQVMEGEATGAREPFQKDDKARFIVFKRLGKEVDWRNAVASESFIIEDEVSRESVPFRVKH